MSERTSTFDLGTLAGIAGTVFLAVSLFTFDPLDPPAEALYPPRAVPENACGVVGAYVAGLLMGAVGWVSYFVLGSAAWMVRRTLRNEPLHEPVLKTCGWLMVTVGLCTFASLTVPIGWAGPHIGPGGWIGALGRAWLESRFALVGAYLFALSVPAAGLLLISETWFLQVAWWLTWGGPDALIRHYRAKAEAERRRLADAAVYAVAAGPTPEVSALPYVPATVVEADPVARTSRTEPDAEIPIRTRMNGADRRTEAASAATSAPIPLAEPAANTTPLPVEPPVPESVRAAASAAPVGLRVNPPVQGKGKNAPPAPPALEEETRAKLNRAGRGQGRAEEFELPSLELLMVGETVRFEEHEQDVRRKAQLLERTFENFGLNVKVVEIDTGPVIAQFEVELEAGLRLSKITGLADDLAIALRVPSVRIVAPIPGKNTVGIEVPNKTRQMVRMREVIEESTEISRKMRIPIFLGKDVSGKPLVTDLTAMPHLLIAGRTGTGKSVCLNTIIGSILMTRRPDEVKLLLIDPKMVELISYAKVPHLMHPVVTDMRKAEAILGWSVEKMEERYALLARAGVRHISAYNQLGKAELVRRMQPETEEEERDIPLTLPYIVIVADEMADLMMTAAKEVENHIIRLAQKSRAVGIHLVLATQKPTVDVITGLIKSNLPARISFQVASRTDSRVVLDEMGADKLLGSGDMLYLSPQTSTLMRGQCTYISDDEINSVCAAVATVEPQYAPELVRLKPKDEEGKPGGGGIPKNRDELYEAAIEIVIREGRGSVSLLQRNLGIGYGRAARLIDYMAEDGVVGEYNGSQARDVLLTLEQWEEMQQAKAPTPAAPKRGGGSEPKRGSAPTAVAVRSEPIAPPARGKASAPAARQAESLHAIHDDEETDFEDLFLDRDADDEPTEIPDIGDFGDDEEGTADDEESEFF